jgi:hypothetical protein
VRQDPLPRRPRTRHQENSSAIDPGQRIGESRTVYRLPANVAAPEAEGSPVFSDLDAVAVLDEQEQPVSTAPLLGCETPAGRQDHRRAAPWRPASTSLLCQQPAATLHRCCSSRGEATNPAVRAPSGCADPTHGGSSRRRTVLSSGTSGNGTSRSPAPPRCGSQLVLGGSDTGYELDASFLGFAQSRCLTGSRRFTGRQASCRLLFALPNQKPLCAVT